MITTVAFDMDDTLYDEIDYCSSGFKVVAEFLADIHNTDADAVFEAFWGEFSAGNHKSTFNAAMDMLGIVYTAEDIKKLVRMYREHKPDIALPSESRKILDELYSRYTLALLTDGFLPAQRYKVEALGIKKYFKFIIYTEELGREFWKPNTLGFEMILEKLDSEPSQTVYIADNAKKDFIGPNQLGIKTIQVKRANKVHLAPPPDNSAVPGYITERITDIPELLKSL